MPNPKDFIIPKENWVSAVDTMRCVVDGCNQKALTKMDGAFLCKKHFIKKALANTEED